MTPAGLFAQLQELIGLIDLNPPTKQLVRFLSRNIDPTGDVCGVAWMRENQSGTLETIANSGLKISLDPEVEIGISDRNVVAKALRSGKVILFDMRKMFSEYKEATHHKELLIYPSGIALPLSSDTVLGLVFTSDEETMREFLDYFELVRALLSLWCLKEGKELSTSPVIPRKSVSGLTERQQRIVELIKEGRTNASIAEILGFSESLIRQETIFIYRKLGIPGRKALIESS